ncbi:unnamed protein product [Musa acuminata subsp. malaccensis]|uniref:(wild Malaysian banana) hypothetical protein n=1 Tax=Musa acuminata subsp. malaccensis TaxID=214687 RepID=A0A804KQI3_MUSAM|nr:PREDICTED: uncharacterized protein LOC103999548 [Musa acuminata subsp. malaccensis]CAG1836956.1 unnamed protein product [Musa acuminata subsp. malaccensis]
MQLPRKRHAWLATLACLLYLPLVNQAPSKSLHLPSSVPHLAGVHGNFLPCNLFLLGFRMRGSIYRDGRLRCCHCIGKGMAAARDSMGFQDFLPRMAERLGAEGLMEELCKGFKLLMDPERGVITSESLRRNVAALGLVGLGDDELMGMVREGDLNGDGVLDQMEFCVLMVRLSPELIEGSLPDVFNSSPTL